MMSDILSMSRVIIGIVILAAAAVSDWKTRTVSNKYWILMGTVGISILGLEIIKMVDSVDGYEWNHLLILVPICILFYDVFWDREPILGKRINVIPIILYIIAITAAIGMVWVEGSNTKTLGLLTIPIMIVLAYVFYYTGLLHGGADAKAFMAIAILFPFYPLLGGGLPFLHYPSSIAEQLSLVFPFAFLVLMNAAIIQVLVVPLIMVIHNLTKKNFGFPEMLLGYRMSIYDVPKKFVWPMEVIRDEELTLILFPKKLKNIKKELIELKDHGIENIWVTPKVPFIIPMLGGLIFSVIIGNLIVILF